MKIDRQNLILNILSQIPELTYRNLSILLDSFSLPEAVLSAEENIFDETGLDPVILSKISEIDFETRIKEQEHFFKSLGISLLSVFDPQYPELLREIPKPPLLLYVRGNIDALNQVGLAVIGTRKITAYGQSIMPNLLNPLIDQGINIISGLAYGVDALAHTLAVKKHAPTVAVLAGGIDDHTIYPKDHVTLARAIIENGGAVISEYAPLTAPQKMNFPARNRIISGLSKATLVIECPARSGALITASYALDQNRDVLAVPGSILWENSLGTNELIKKGAAVITSADDLLEYFEIEDQEQTDLQDEVTKNPILAHMINEARTLEELSELTGLPPSEIASIVSTYEIEGTIERVNGNAYIIVNN